ncbi:TIGR04197 family type VII secretion effector [Enterococcus sp. LJL128]|uniref:TIGR04197 family type VII secretion effector n=1 Tax=Enterococcus sp. LJL51 TaxID=3416656 RepID=UPI003CF8AF40
MTIKNDAGAAAAIGGALASKAISDKGVIQYAEESNLTAVGTGKERGESAGQAVASYRTLLVGDAQKISSLGQEFAGLDQALAGKMN